jgi:ketosteroid isomerase-like protein
MTTRSLLPAALLLFGCSLRQRPVAPEPARGPARDSLFHVDETRGDSVAARGGVDGALALFSPGVAFLRSGVPGIYGRDAARALFAATPTAGARSWQPLGGGVSADLRSGYTFGVAAHAGPPNSPPRLDRYVAYWTRERAQPWRIAAYAEVNGQSGAEVSFTAAQLAPPTAPPTGSLARIVSDVRVADSLFSDLADRMGTGFAFAQTAASDGVMFGGTRLIVGPAAIEEYFRAQPPGTSLTWRPIYTVVASSGDLGFTIGESVRTGRGPSGAAVQSFGKYLTIWRKERNGTWKFVVDGGNLTPPKSDRD